MEWTLEDNNQIRQLKSAEDIKSAVLEAMDETIEYFILWLEPESIVFIAKNVLRKWPPFYFSSFILKGQFLI